MSQNVAVPTVKCTCMPAVTKCSPIRILWFYLVYFSLLFSKYKFNCKFRDSSDSMKKQHNDIHVCMYGGICITFKTRLQRCVFSIKSLGQAFPYTMQQCLFLVNCVNYNLKTTVDHWCYVEQSGPLNWATRAYSPLFPEESSPVFLWWSPGRFLSCAVLL